MLYIQTLSDILRSIWKFSLSFTLAGSDIGNTGTLCEENSTSICHILIFFIIFCQTNAKKLNFFYQTGCNWPSRTKFFQVSKLLISIDRVKIKLRMKTIKNATVSTIRFLRKSILPFMVFTETIRQRGSQVWDSMIGPKFPETKNIFSNHPWRNV